MGPPKLHNHEVMTDQMNSVSNQWSETVSEVWPTTHPPDDKNFLKIIINYIYIYIYIFLLFLFLFLCGKCLRQKSPHIGGLRSSPVQHLNWICHVAHGWGMKAEMYRGAADLCRWWVPVNRTITRAVLLHVLLTVRFVFFWNLYRWSCPAPDIAVGVMSHRTWLRTLFSLFPSCPFLSFTTTILPLIVTRWVHSSPFTS